MSQDFLKIILYAICNENTLQGFPQGNMESILGHTGGSTDDGYEGPSRIQGDQL